MPYRVSGRRVEVLLVTGRQSRDWIIPKGHVEGGLGPSRSAAKEALEEAGVVGRIGKSPVGHYAYSKRGREHLVEVYDLCVRQELAEWDERGQRQREWMSIEQAVRRVRNKALREVIAGLAARVR
jgi:8-oxo-dGTP pyrophosphatase MutT (NUDIX family)